MVRDDGVVLDDPLGEFLVERADVCEEEVFVVIDELFLQGTIEPFVVGVHFWASRVSPVVGELMVFEQCVESSLELAAVV